MHEREDEKKWMMLSIAELSTGDECIRMEHYRSICTGENHTVWGKSVPVPLCPPHITYGLAWDQTQAAMVRGCQQTF